MRTITCAYLLANPDAPPARAQQIGIADGSIASVGRSVNPCARV